MFCLGGRFSSVLEQYQAVRLHAYIREVKVKPASMQLLFNADRDGWSLETLYKKVGSAHPCILLVRTLRSRAVMGAYLSCAMAPPTGTVRGDARCFVFRLDGSKPLKCKSAISQNAAAPNGGAPSGSDPSARDDPAATGGVDSGASTGSASPSPSQTPLLHAQKQYARFAPAYIIFGSSTHRIPTNAIKLTSDLRMVSLRIHRETSQYSLNRCTHCIATHPCVHGCDVCCAGALQGYSGPSDTYGNTSSLVPEEISSPFPVEAVEVFAVPSNKAEAFGVVGDGEAEQEEEEAEGEEYAPGAETPFMPITSAALGNWYDDLESTVAGSVAPKSRRKNRGRTGGNSEGESEGDGDNEDADDDVTSRRGAQTWGLESSADPRDRPSKARAGARPGAGVESEQSGWDIDSTVAPQSMKGTPNKAIPNVKSRGDEKGEDEDGWDVRTSEASQRPSMRTKATSQSRASRHSKRRGAHETGDDPAPQSPQPPRPSQVQQAKSNKPPPPPEDQSVDENESIMEFAYQSRVRYLLHEYKEAKKRIAKIKKKRVDIINEVNKIIPPGPLDKKSLSAGAAKSLLSC